MAGKSYARVDSERGRNWDNYSCAGCGLCHPAAGRTIGCIRGNDKAIPLAFQQLQRVRPLQQLQHTRTVLIAESLNGPFFRSKRPQRNTLSILIRTIRALESNIILTRIVVNGSGGEKQTRLPCRNITELPQIVRTSQKAPADVRIRSFSMRGVAPAAPLQFLVGCAHGCRSEYSGQPSRWPQRR